MQVEITKQVIETVSVEPGYYKGKLLSDTFYYINQSGTLIYIKDGMTWIITPNKRHYQNEVKEIITNYIPCDKDEFEAAKDKALDHLKHYVSFPETATQVTPLADSPAINTMNTFDPKPDEVKDEQATEQQNALESATQDQAMEVDSEEGTTEG